MKMTQFKYVQRLGKDSFQVSSQTQIQNMNLYLMFYVYSLDSSLNLLRKTGRATQLLSAHVKNILENVMS